MTSKDAQDIKYLLVVLIVVVLLLFACSVPRQIWSEVFSDPWNYAGIAGYMVFSHVLRPLYKRHKAKADAIAYAEYLAMHKRKKELDTHDKALKEAGEDYTTCRTESSWKAWADLINKGISSSYEQSDNEARFREAAYERMATMRNEIDR